MDTFMIGFFILVAFIAVLGIYTIFFDKSGGSGSIKGFNRPQEDENLKDLRRMERHRFWRDYADEGRK